MNPGDIRRWNVPYHNGGVEHFVVIDVKSWANDDSEPFAGDVTFLTDGMVVTDDINYIKSISEAVREVR